MVAHTAARTLPTAIQALRNSATPTGRVLSAYLDTSPQRVSGGAYLLALRDAVKAIRSEFPEVERALFERAVEQVETKLTSQKSFDHPGLAVFASGATEFLHTVPLPVPPVEEITWGDKPRLVPLERLLDDFERVAVVLFYQERARLFTIFLGEIEERREIKDHVPRKQSTGDWFALAQTRHARHREWHVLHHVERTTESLMELLRRRPFDHLLLGGPDEALHLLRQHLPRPLRARLAGTLSLELIVGEADIVRAARKAAERIERQEELRAVQELLDAETTPRTAIGLAASLAAVSEGRVHQLFLADGFTGVGGECPQCARLVEGLDPCPICGVPTVPLGDLGELLVERSVQQGAKVGIVSADAAVLLLAHGGVGAWTRY